MMGWLQGLAAKLGLLPTPQVRLLTMMTGGWTGQAVHVAARLGLADLLADGERSAAELARETGVSEERLYRLLRALGALGVLSEGAERRFTLGAVGEPLRTDVEGSLHAGAMLMGERFYYDAWGSLYHSLDGDRSAFEIVHGKPLFRYLEDHPEAEDLFGRWMVEVNGLSISELLRMYDFSGFRRVVDVGGGRGAFLTALLRAHPEMRGVLFDLPHVVAGVYGSVPLEIEDRLEVVAGDFFELVPEAGDAYTMKIVLHDWDDDEAIAILEACRRSMPVEARLLVMEAVIRPGGGFQYGKLADLEMMVLNAGGRERTREQFGRLFEAAGFRLERVVTGRATLAVLEAVPIEAPVDTGGS